MNHIQFKNKSSKDFNIIIESLGRRQKAEEEIDIYDIPNRSGHLSVRTNKYKSYERSVGIAVRDIKETAMLNAWLDGIGKLRTSIDEGGFFKAETIKGLEPSKIIRKWNRFYVTFLVQPFFYLDCGDRNIEITSPTTIINMGTHYSEPIIKIVGNGDVRLNINSDFIDLKDIGPYIVIDTEREIIYRDTQNLGKKMIGEFPTLRVEENNIAWEGNVTKIEIVPRWREL